MYVRFLVFQAFISTVTFGFDESSRIFETHHLNQGRENNYIFAQAELDKEIAVNSFGIEELTIIEQRMREISTRYEDLDSRIIDFLDRLEKIKNDQVDFHQRLIALEEKVEQKVDNLFALQQKDIGNLRKRTRLIQELLESKSANDFNSKITTLEERMVYIQRDILEEVQVSQKKSLENLESRLALIEEELDTVLNSFENSSEFSNSHPKGAKEVSGSTPKDLQSIEKQVRNDYYAAQMRYEGRDYLGAIEHFAALIDKYPNNKLAANSQYWIGDSYFASRQYELAIKALTKVLTNYPNSNKVPDALLVIGNSYKQLGKFDNAREAWQTLINKFPNQELAQKAAQRISNLP